MQKRYLYIFFILFSCLAPRLVNAIQYNEPWRVVSYGQNEGLPEGKTYGIFVQKNGTTWLGTQSGIAKFDGYKWNNIKFIHSNRLSTQNLTIRERNENTLVCLYLDTLYEIKNNKYRKLLYTINNNVQRILDYAFLPDGTEYFISHVGYEYTQIRLIQKKGKKYKVIKTLSNLHNIGYVQLFQNNDNSMLFNDGQQIFSLSQKGILKPITQRFNWLIKVINSQVDKRGNLYFYLNSDYTINGIYTYTKEGKLLQENPFSSNLCKSFDVDKEGNILALSDIGKVFIKQKNEWKETGIFENYYNKCFIQYCSSGNIWIGCINKLLCYNINENKCKSIDVGNTYETNAIYDIFIDNAQNTWLAKYRGVTKIDKKNKHTDLNDILGNSVKDITTINQDKEGNIWIGSGVHEKSTYKYDGTKFTRIGQANGFTDKCVHKIWKDTNGDLWFSVFDNSDPNKNNTAGIYKLVNGKFEKNNLVNKLLANGPRLYSMLFEKNGTIWLGTNTELIRMENNNVKSWSKIGDIGIGKVSDITTDKFGNIWFASAGAGISKVMDKDSLFSISNENNEVLPLDYCDIEFDINNTLWYGGKEFLTAYQNGMYYKIGSAEGLSGQASWPIKYYNNNIFVGTYGGGLNIIDLKRINESHPIIEIIGKISVGRSVFVHWKALSKNIILNNSKIYAIWRIDGGPWQANTIGDITIQELNYGKHRFEIRSHSELPNQYDNNITELEILIPYPFYLSKLYVIPISILVILLIIGVYIFIVSQSKSSKLIQQKQEQLKNLGGSLPIIPFVIDENGFVIESFVNEKNNHLDINLSNNEKLVNQLPEQYKLKINQAIFNCFAHQSQETVELSFTKFGKEITYEIRFSPYSENFKQVKKTATCVAINISQNKKNEQELIHAKLAAESSEKAKMLFLTNMSHEIRTPMNAIVGITDILLGDNIDVKFKDNLNIIKHSADNLLVIINDILDFSKIEAGKVELEHIEFDVIELLDNLVKTFLLKTSQKRIFFEINIDENLPHRLIGDPYRLNQILVNLINNAIKFTEKGGITFRVDILNIEDNSIKLSFKISDTGIGIAPSKIESIFESFTQESNVITRKYGGTGLGLTISKRLVGLQQGKIKVESELGVGSKFIIELPFGISRKLYKFKKEVSSLKDLTDLKILVVEDNNMNQIVAKQILHKWNAYVDTVNNGVEAIEILSHKSYDVILMDLQMPLMDGYEATKIIRDENSKVLNHHVPIIALTADAFPEIKRKALECGMNDFISKPFKQDDLFVKLTKHGYQLD
jgi:signal transduction histidine kinase/ligand-binding sensor domain-containing protein/ActR/RegA family two-component response regulator